MAGARRARLRAARSARSATGRRVRSSPAPERRGRRGQGGGAPGGMGRGAISAARHGPGSALIARAGEAWPARLAAAELFGPGGLGAFDEPLLLALLARTVVGDAALEMFLAACRCAL